MPELPDVEAFRAVLASCAQGAVIRRVDVYDTGVLHGVSARRLRGALQGRAFAEPRRHGKWLIARTVGDGGGTDGDSGATVMWHFGMTGELVCRTAGEELHAHDRVVLTVEPPPDDDGGGGAPPGARELRYRDQRKLQGLWLADADGVDRMLADQGPDAAAVRRTEFDEALSGRRGGLKPTLTDQSVVAGLGNLLADEILWQVRLNPRTRVNALSDAQQGHLYDGMRRTVTASVRAGRIPPRASWLTGHRYDEDPHCPRCHTALRFRRVSGRATAWCPRCQGT